jgi:hypothetical protein
VGADSESEVKHTVYLPADFVRQLQQGAIGERRSSYGAVQSFLRQAVRAAMADWTRKRFAPGVPAPPPAGALIEVPAADVRFYEHLVRYMAHQGTDSEQAWKQGLRRAVAAWREGHG